MTRTGKDYINSLRDGRAIYLDGQSVHDPVDHPAYRNAVRTVARLYDFQAAPENLELMTFRSPTSGGRVNPPVVAPGTRLPGRGRNIRLDGACTELGESNTCTAS